MLSLTGFADALSERKFLRALLLEFVGVGIFQLFSGALPVETINDQPNYTDQITAATIAVVNGLLYSALVYWTRDGSGGHLNPAVTIAITASGHMSAIKGVLYIFVQVVGGICGALLAHFSMSGGAYCFDKESTATSEDVWELFIWEIFMTWLFTMVFFSCYLDPGHGDMNPAVLGIAVIGCLWAGIAHSGGAINPARIISPTVANISSDRQCQADVIWYYLTSEGIGALLGAFCTMVIHGPGPLHQGRQRGTSSVGRVARL